jgi:23S rRNA (guanosine2251-2'-O)-methyltransferase
MPGPGHDRGAVGEVTEGRSGARSRRLPPRRRSRSGSPSRKGVLVGRRPALEAIRSGAAREILVAETARSTPGLREVTEAARGAGVMIRRVSLERVEELAGGVVHQGVAVRVEPPRKLSEADLEADFWPDDALVLVLDGVSDPQNLGAVARTAEAGGASALVLRARRGAGVTTAAIRASAGALLHVPVAEVVNIPRAVRRLQGAGFWTVGLHAGSGRSLLETDRPAGRLALVLGAEGEGLSRLVRERCDELMEIPMRGRVASLNVSVAAGVAVFAYALRGKKASGPRAGAP